jgi:SAM-dependent methyltransferase
MTRQQSPHQGGLPPLSIRASLRYDVVGRAFAGLHAATVLEIGCGQGALGARVAEVTMYTGVEPDDESFAMARRRIEPRGGTVLHGIHTIIPAGSQFDVVCAFEVLEHIEDDAGALAEWVRLIRPGGHLLLSVPAFQERFGPLDTYAGHFRRYSPSDLSALLVQSGLVDPDVTVYGWPLGYPWEWVRNAIDRRKIARTEDLTPEELTKASGRTFQPRGRMTGGLIQVGVAPFRLAQRLRPTKGTGLVAMARRPG